MYIKDVHIKNIRSLSELHITFKEPAGWHVLLGDNGSGKTSVIRAISAALVGPTEILRLDPTFGNWVRHNTKEATIDLTIVRNKEADKRSGQGGARGGVKEIDTIVCKTAIRQHEGNGQGWFFDEITNGKKDKAHPSYYNWGTGDGWFSAAFGPYRRFTGGNSVLENFYIRNPKIGAHLTAFKEDAALTESVVWLKDKLLRSLSNPKSEDKTILDGIKHFLNQDNLLPEGFKLEDITADGPFFTIPNSNGKSVHLYELSEGIKSVTSLAFELLRLLLNTYTANDVFGNFLDTDITNDFVPVKGVVLIDEIDAHLHPTWQARIGDWFTKCFPNIQFIVTTHSPIICRAAVKGSVWQLPSPNSDRQPKRIEGIDLQGLLYGDILDAYGTGVFGHSITRSVAGHEKLQRLAELNVRYFRDQASEKEKTERQNLLNLFPSDGTIFTH